MTLSHSIMITGAGGMLGTDLARQARERGLPVAALTRTDCDVTSAEDCRRALAENLPAVVINCAAYTKVDLAESEPERAHALNASAAENLALACGEAGTRLIHVSTDYVFDGTKPAPYQPDDQTNPINTYGRTKLAGELAIARIMAPGTWTIARTSWLYGHHGPNFVETMLRLAGDGKDLRVINDQHGTPTFTADLAEALLALAAKPGAGIVHATGAGECTWFEFAAEIFRQSGVHPASLSPCATADYPTPAKRPANSRLAGDSLIAAGVPLLPDWRDALGRYLAGRI